MPPSKKRGNIALLLSICLSLLVCLSVSRSFSLQRLPLRRWNIPIINSVHSFSSQMFPSLVLYTDAYAFCQSIVCPETFHSVDFFSRTDGPIWTNTWNKHLWAKGIQICVNQEDIMREDRNLGGVIFISGTILEAS